MLKRIKKFLIWELGIWFGDFRWCRQFIGGKWELWMTGCCGTVWMHREEFERISGVRPGNCFGTPSEEDYTDGTPKDKVRCISANEKREVQKSNGHKNDRKRR